MYTFSKHLIFFYTKEQVFDLIQDVEKYPEFMPWIQSSHVYANQDNIFLADLNIAYLGQSFLYTSRVSTQKNDTFWRIHVDGLKGPFQSLKTQWCISQKSLDSISVDFSVSLQLSNPIIQTTLRPIFSLVSAKTLEAFKKRASVLYGPS